MNTQPTEDEAKIISRCDTPERAQEYIDSLSYNWESDGVSTLRSFRRVVRDKTAHCLEGAVAAAAILGHHGYAPWLLYMDALDICHAAFLYTRREADGARRFGTVAMSRDPNLKGREAVYPTIRDLMMSYHPHYYNYFTGDRNELTLRGYATFHLGGFGEDFAYAEHELLCIEEHVWGLTYRGLFPPSPTHRYYRLVGRTVEIEWL